MSRYYTGMRLRGLPRVCAAAVEWIVVVAIVLTQGASNGRPVVGPQSIEGLWNFATLTPLERPAELAGKASLSDAEAAVYEKTIIERGDRDRRDGGAEVDVARAVNDIWFDRGTHLAAWQGRRLTSLIFDPEDGRLPALTAAGKAAAAQRAGDARAHPADGPENRSLQERCLAFNAGPPIQPGPYNNYVRISLFPNEAVIFTEMIHDGRVIPLDGRPHLPERVRLWLGDSRGHWDGDTLVVDTTNFTDKTRFHGADARLHLIERFTRTDASTLLYELTVDDPTVFTKPWSARLPMTRSNERLYEYACHEGNYALGDILRGARVKGQ